MGQFLTEILPVSPLVILSMKKTMVDMVISNPGDFEKACTSEMAEYRVEVSSVRCIKIWE